MAGAILPMPSENSMNLYNALLYKRGQKQRFSNHAGHWEAKIINAYNNGTLEVQLADSAIIFYHHGQVLWEWGNE